MIDELRCIYCGMCEEACPVDAIELTTLFDLTGASRSEMMFDKEKLLSVYDQTKDTTDPVRTHRGKLGPCSELNEDQGIKFSNPNRANAAVRAVLMLRVWLVVPTLRRGDAETSAGSRGQDSCRASHHDGAWRLLTQATTNERLSYLVS